MRTKTSQPLNFWSFLLSLCHKFTSTRWTGDTEWHTEELVDRAGFTPPEKGQAGSWAFSLIQLLQSNVNSLPLSLLSPRRIWAYTWIYRLSWSLFFFSRKIKVWADWNSVLPICNEAVEVLFHVSGVMAEGPNRKSSKHTQPVLAL